MADKQLKDIAITPEVIEQIANIGAALNTLRPKEIELLRLFAHSAKPDLDEFLNKALEVEKTLQGPLGRILYGKN